MTRSVPIGHLELLALRHILVLFNRRVFCLVYVKKYLGSVQSKISNRKKIITIWYKYPKTKEKRK